MSNKLVGVAIIKYVCPICGQTDEDASAIAINSILTEGYAKKVESMHNKVVGISDKPCRECQKWIDQDAFFVIGYDKDKTDSFDNPYRSGHIVGIKKTSEFYKSLSDKYKKKDFIFMDYRQMQELGMINQ